RQDDGHGPARAGQSGGPGRERPGDRPPAAQLHVIPLPERPRELERHRRQVHHRYHRDGRRRVHPEDDGPRAAQSRRRGGHASLHAVVARQREARLPARLPHRGLGRHPGAVVRLHGRDSPLPLRWRLRQAAQGRLPPLLRRHDRLLGPRRDDPKRRQLLRDRLPHRGPVGHPRPAVPLEVDGSRVQAGETHAGDIPSAHRRDGWSGVLADADRRAGVRHRRRRRHHPRVGRRTHGGRSQDLRDEPLVPDARLQEPVRRGWWALRLAGGQEPDVDDSRAVDANERVHHGSDEAGRALRDFTQRLSTALAERYQIERQLGEGGMAVVYLARDVKHDREVGLKVLRPELMAVLGAERFLHEINVTAHLQHPHILTLHDSGEADGLVFYVMPYVEGESLRDRLTREKQLSIDEAIEITKAVASALDYAHRHGVIHRDIKPENILLHDGQPLVADFGIALAVSAAGGNRLTETGLSIGTPQYMSPEQAMGDRTLDARSDVYSLAAVLYEMLAGEPPYTGPTAQAIVAKVITERPVPITVHRDTVPPHVGAALHKALAKLPADRFAGAAQFSDALLRPGAIPLTFTGTGEG